MLLTELVLLPIAHGYFVHICAWPLVHSRPAIHFGISFVLLHWLMGMVSCTSPPVDCPYLRLQLPCCLHPLCMPSVSTRRL